MKLRVFLDRNFALGCLLIGLFGGVIYGVITLLPLFYQELLGYNARARAWRSVRAASAPLCHAADRTDRQRIDNRYILAVGFTIFGVCGLWFARVDLDISQWTCSGR